MINRNKVGPMVRNVVLQYTIGYILIILVFLIIIALAIQHRDALWCVWVDIACCVLWGFMFFTQAKQTIDEKTIKFELVNTNATLPSKRDDDAGYDVYATFNEKWKLIEPHQTELIPTGLASAFSNKYVAILKERGSTGSMGIGQRAGIIDSGYRGEWFVALTNHNDYPIAICKQEWADEFEERYGHSDAVIYPYERAICQALFLPVPQLDMMRITREEYATVYSNTVRGAGALGSSGK